MTSFKIPRKYQRILMRADGSSSIGMGHVVRSLVLARELLDLGAQVEVWGSAVEAGKALAESFGPIPIRNLAMPDGTAAEIEYIAGLMPDLVVADGYHFTREFFAGLESAGIAYGIIDDNLETKASAPRFVLNQNPSASAELYSSWFPASQLFLGPSWALIRREFFSLRGSESNSEYDVYLSLGGSDLRNLTLGIARHLAGEGLSIVVGVGPGVKNRDGLLAALGRLPGVACSVPSEVPSDMAKSDVLVLGAGSSLWEANALGKRCIGLIVADNQVEPAEGAVRDGLISRSIDVRNENDVARLGTRLLNCLREISRQPSPQNQKVQNPARELALNILR